MLAGDSCLVSKTAMSSRSSRRTSSGATVNQPRSIYRRIPTPTRTLECSTMIAHVKIPQKPNGWVLLADEGDGLETYYLLTSADHNIVQVNRINSDGTLGDKVSDLSVSH